MVQSDKFHTEAAHFQVCSTIGKIHNKTKLNCVAAQLLIQVSREQSELVGALVQTDKTDFGSGICSNEGLFCYLVACRDLQSAQVCS